MFTSQHPIHAGFPEERRIPGEHSGGADRQNCSQTSQGRGRPPRAHFSRHAQVLEKMERVLVAPPSLDDGRSSGRRGQPRPERPAFEGSRIKRRRDSALVSTQQQRVFLLPPSQVYPLAPPSAITSWGTRVVKSHAVGWSPWQPTGTKPSPQPPQGSSSYFPPLGPGRFELLPEVGCRAPLASGTRLREGGTASPGAPPPALKHLGAGVSTPDVARRPPAVRAPSLGQAAGESGRTRGRGCDFSL